MTPTGNGATTTDSSGWMRRESCLKHFGAPRGGEAPEEGNDIFKYAITDPATPRK